MSRRPRIVISLGDPCGIGPELLLSRLPAIQHWTDVTVVGSRAGADLLEGLPGAPVAWRNPDSGRYGSVVPGQAYASNGMNCRQFTHTIYIDGRPQTARGTACRNPDGTWQPV